MSDSGSEKWAKIEKLGRGRFVLLYGVLGWGIPTAIIFAIVQACLLGWDEFLFQLVPALVLFPLGGILWGRFMWRFLERKRANATTARN